MGHEQVIVERRGDVVLITLNRPEKLNAWTPQTLGELLMAIDDDNHHPDVGAIVVTGAGRAFCAGADIGGQFRSRPDAAPDARAKAAAQQRRGEQDDERAGRWVELCRASKPLVAAINGHCMGVGLTMVLPFDRLIAGTEETDLNIVQRREIAALEEAFRTPEHREAVDAFLEKRPPKSR